MQTETIKFKLGERVSINLGHRHGDSSSRIIEIRRSSGGGILYILENGQWLDSSEISKLR